MAETSKSLLRLRFEVFGRVQGVFFRKYTQRAAQRFGVNGWVRNTPRGTVEGEVEGPPPAVREMQRWLRTEGSPESHIEKAEFSEEEAVERASFKDFSVRR